MNGIHDSRRQLAAGVLITAIGVLLLLDRLNLIDVSIGFHNLWPLILIWIGVTRLMRGGSPRWRFDADTNKQAGDRQ